MALTFKMKYIRFFQTFFSLLGTHHVWEFLDGRCDPPKHLWKTRIGFVAAFKVAKIIHL